MWRILSSRSLFCRDAERIRCSATEFRATQYFIKLFRKPHRAKAVRVVTARRMETDCGAYSMRRRSELLFGEDFFRRVGSANGNRTRISALKGPRANRCTIAPN